MLRAAVAAVLAVALVAPGAARGQRRIEPGDITPTLVALQDIADANGGNRAAGRPGEPATAGYIATRLDAMGWEVTRQPIRFPYWEERTPPVVYDLVPGRDVLTLRLSGRGDVTARVENLRVSGCKAEHVRRFPRGRIAIVQPGGCFYRDAALRLQRAGAAAVLISEPPPRTGPRTSSLVYPGVRVPALAVTPRAARRLARIRTPIRVKVDGFGATRIGTNVIAERSGTAPREVVMAGGHLDSVPEGPGINDNGSGIAALIAIADRLGEMRLRDTVRIGFWTAEEWGLFGSLRYVDGLSRRQRREIGVYLNVDMVGSPNPVPQIYEAHPTVTRPLERRLPGAPSVNIYGSSDHTAFLDVGVPSSGIYTGALEVKSAAQQRRWGGVANQPRDACYHRACDTIANVDAAMTAMSANALAGALAAFARD